MRLARMGPHPISRVSQIACARGLADVSRMSGTLGGRADRGEAFVDAPQRIVSGLLGVKLTPGRPLGLLSSAPLIPLPLVLPPADALDVRHRHLVAGKAKNSESSRAGVRSANHTDGQAVRLRLDQSGRIDQLAIDRRCE